MKPIICRACGHSIRPASHNPNICAECDEADLVAIATSTPPPAKVTAQNTMAWARNFGAGKPDITTGALAAALADVLQNPGKIAHWRARVIDCKN